MGSIPDGNPPSKYANVPRIDVSPLFGKDLEAKKKVAQQIDAAVRDTGFFYAANHGIDVKKLSDMTKKFHFSITDEEKWKLAIRAYNPANQSQIRNGYYLPIKDKKAVESFCFLNPNFTPDHPRIKDGTPLHEANVWPDEEKHPGFREYQESYFWEVFNLSKVLLRGFALALGLDENFFDPSFTEHDTLSSVVLIRYPYIENYPPAAIKTAADGTKLSFEWHEDISLITVLYQSLVQNLQVELPGQGFVDVHADDECFLINCGSYFAYITDNQYFAPIHRVKYVNAERQSLPFFVNLGWDSKIVPFSPGNKDYKPPENVMTYGEYLKKGLWDLIVKNGQT